MSERKLRRIHIRQMVMVLQRGDLVGVVEPQVAHVSNALHVMQQKSCSKILCSSLFLNGVLVDFKIHTGADVTVIPALVQNVL